MGADSFECNGGGCGGLPESLRGDSLITYIGLGDCGYIVTTIHACLAEGMLQRGKTPIRVLSGSRCGPLLTRTSMSAAVECQETGNDRVPSAQSWVTPS